MGLKTETMLSIGMISMALGILIGRFVHLEISGFSVSDFIEGILIGLSLTMNLAYLALRSKQKNPVM
jgi:hypothetical protein